MTLAMSVLAVGPAAQAAEQPTTTATTIMKKTAYNEVNRKLQEPTKTTKCAYCNMIVYRATEALGAYAAQAITKDGQNVFFDDVGCMFGYQFKNDTVMTKYVRDYNTKKWIRLSKAVIVKSDAQTPMHYGYTFFAKKADANKFMKTAKNAKLATIHDIKKDAKQRYDAKNSSSMQMEMGM